MADYSPKEIEAKWQAKWLEEKTYEPDLDSPKKPFYNLMMFPYPSAEGLHVGNVYAFVGSDIYGRMKRMEGNDVFEPIGLDGFGIHSENYALKIDAHPMDQAATSEARFYKQLEKIGNGFAWEEHLETYDPEYYRWTQWIFAEMFRRGLAYRKKQSVNWCPKDQTVLADEQVENGKCERCGTEVVKKELEQWFFKITEYADRLLENIPKLDWSEKVKIAQTNWIGKSRGLLFKSPVKDSDLVLETFNAHFEAFMADTFVVIAPDHPMLPKLLEGTPQEKTVLEHAKKMILDREEGGYAERPSEGVFTGRYILDPVSKSELPIWVASYALADYGTGIVKCSAHDTRDFAFAKKYKIPLKVVLVPPEPEKQQAVRDLEVCYTDMENGILGEPAVFNGKRAGDVRSDIIRYCVDNKLAEEKIIYRLRDWLISRQRYWGPPIPMIFCDACAQKSVGERKDMPGWYAVKDTDLPVILPRIKNFRPTGTGISPLAAEKTFYEVACPKCKSPARRETDVSDTFLDSAWYYLRYLDPNNADTALNKKRVSKWLPAEMYIGGSEHAVLHLLYVRFLAMVLHDWKLVDFEEPFKKYRAQGLLIKDGAKMSKSKGNVINPDEYIENFGADTLRMYLMFLAPFQEGGDFRDSAILGLERFLKRVWKLQSSAGDDSNKSDKKNARPLLHKTIKKVTEDIENLHYNTAISALMILLRDFEDANPSEAEFETFLHLLAPFAPHITEEIWRETLGHKDSIHRDAWPMYDKALIVDEKITIALQVNGKTRDLVEADATITEAMAKDLALASEKIKKTLAGAEPKKIIYVDKKLVNIVL